MPPKPDFPLTRFICDLIDATPERLRNMPIDKTAKHYGISPDYVRGYRDMYLGNGTASQGSLF